MGEPRSGVASAGCARKPVQPASQVLGLISYKGLYAGTVRGNKAKAKAKAISE